MPKDVSYRLQLPKIKSDILLECCICLDKKVTISQPCGLETHNICVTCITKIIGLMPISMDYPELCCQYPYSDCEYLYSRSFIRNILKDKYPIYKIASDSYVYSDYSVTYCPDCSKILIFDGELQEETVYKCIYCLKNHCFTCKTICKEGEVVCSNCEGYYNINPGAYNYFFYKEPGDRKVITDYFYKNMDIDCKIAVKQITEKIESLSVKCPVCASSIFRTEQCNSLHHCHVEVCTFCGMFSKIGKTLPDHWSARGHGCPRWTTDPIYKKYIPSYVCKDGACYSHITGECFRKDHSQGIHNLDEFKKKQYMYHSLISLLPSIRYKVIENLPEHIKEYVPCDETMNNLDCNSLYDETRHYVYNGDEY